MPSNRTKRQQTASLPQAAPTLDASPLLEVRSLCKNFGGLEAVKNVRFECREGETLGLIGPNGAGKTTVFNLITGFVRPTSGQVIFAGRDLVGSSPSGVCRAGIARTFQGVRLFRNMTVWENVWIAQNARTNYLAPIQWFRPTEDPALSGEVERILEEFRLLAKRDVLAGELAFGDMRRLEICRALATRPRLLLLDEPASGLTPVETNQLIDELRQLSGTGLTIIVIEHDMHVALGISDRVIVLNFGQMLATGSPAEIRRNPEVIEAYLGSSVESAHA